MTVNEVGRNTDCLQLWKCIVTIQQPHRFYVEQSFCNTDFVAFRLFQQQKFHETVISHDRSYDPSYDQSYEYFLFFQLSSRFFLFSVVAFVVFNFAKRTRMKKTFLVLFSQQKAEHFQWSFRKVSIQVQNYHIRLINFTELWEWSVKTCYRSM